MKQVLILRNQISVSSTLIIWNTQKLQTNSQIKLILKSSHKHTSKELTLIDLFSKLESTCERVLRIWSNRSEHSDPSITETTFFWSFTLTGGLLDQIFFCTLKLIFNSYSLIHMER